ncbi:hybrid sensor histidine kinase/response regulator [Geothrix oryzisoli]|uniref:hybrid sensor histidine kinase/response regulator n=1 Tax=Geothrix oryzisoli TaxID=2922721 RepID=UPI001FAE2C2D|nr:PAS domain-containing sensor histidine kinase [Geothrix oryzisoli]
MYESKEMVNMILDSTEDFIWSVDPVTFGVLSFNRSFSDYFRDRRHHPIKLGDRPEDLFSDPGYINQWRGYFQEALEKGRFETEYATYAGTPILNLVIHRIDRDTRPLALSVFGRDITGLREAQLAQLESEARYRSLFEESPSVKLLIAPETGRIVDANPAAAAFYGWSRDQLLRMRIWEINALSEAEIRQQMELSRTGVKRLFEFRHRGADGSLRDVEVHSAPIRMGEQVLMYSLIHDITERKRTQDALRESEARFRALSESALAGTYIIQEGVLTYVNPTLAELLGYSAEELLGKSPLMVIHPDDQALVTENIRRRIQGTMSSRFETRAVRKDGGIIHIEILGGTICFNGRPGIIGNLLDVTERKKAEEAQAALEGQLQHLQRLEAVGRLAGGIAHDMNNVLAAVMSTASLIQSKGDPCQKQAELILKAAHRGRSLIKGLMAYARKEVEDAELVDLNALVSNEVELLSNTTLQRIQLKTDLDPKLPLFMGSSTALGTALMNLCVNAVDAMPDGGKLIIRTALLGDRELELIVEDTGQGMPPEVLKRAVEPFYTTKPMGKGTGLGLSMVYGTVQAHKGTLAMHSAPGAGTRVQIRLPITPEDPTLPAVEEAVAPSPSGPGLKILLVEDDPIVGEASMSLLENLGHRVTMVAEGYRAIGLAGPGAAWDVVLLDQNMPGMSGLETLRRIRRLHATLPAVITSGYADDEVRDGFRRLGHTAMLGKPYSREELQKSLANLP